MTEQKTEVMWECQDCRNTFPESKKGSRCPICNSKCQFAPVDDSDALAEAEKASRSFSIKEVEKIYKRAWKDSEGEYRARITWQENSTVEEWWEIHKEQLLGGKNED